MLPKIVVCKSRNRDLIRENLDISLEREIGYDGGEAEIKDFREWLNFAVNISVQENNYSLVIWDADKLSKECQSVLLKPLEEKTVGANYLLIVGNENKLLPTIISRCQLEKLELVEDEGKYWSEIVKCWREGPARCVLFGEKIKDLETAGEILDEVVKKLRLELRRSINEKRVKILDLAMQTLRDLKDVRVNPRLCVEDFLIQSWMVTRQV